MFNSAFTAPSPDRKLASSPSEQNLRFILGLKLNQLRKQQGLSLKTLAGNANLAVSYLNEIEKGKKFPKPEKILSLARALGVSYDDLVSLHLSDKLTLLSGVLKSDVLQAMPLEIFGVTPTGLLEMMSASPEKASALFDTFVRIARRFDVTIEDLLLAAMRSYVEQNKNYFEEIEQAAESFRQNTPWTRSATPDLPRLEQHLVEHFNYSVDETTLPAQPELRELRAVTIGGDTDRPRLLLNPQLSPWQKAFLLARELGYRELHLPEPLTTSPITKVVSFAQLVNNFRASYFAGALLLDRNLLAADLQKFFQSPTWDGDALIAIKRKYQATPEMFFHRLSQIIPKFFGLEQMYFVRFDHRRGTPDVRIGKELHYQRMHGTHSIGINETYCRRWGPLRSLLELDAKMSPAGDDLIASAQRARFYATGDEYFNISIAHPHVLEPDMLSCVTIGFLVNDTLRKVIKFWDDDSLPWQEVGDTCERCALTTCQDRAAPPVLREREDRRSRRQQALEKLAQA